MTKELLATIREQVWLATCEAIQSGNSIGFDWNVHYWNMPIPTFIVSKELVKL